MGFSEAVTYGAVSDLVRREVDVASGMKHLIEHCDAVSPSAVWREIADVDFAADADYLKRWLHQLLETEAPEDSIAAFWFGMFDEAGEDGRGFTRLYLAGSTCYDPDDETADWACRLAYLPHGRYADSQVLRQVSAILSAAGKEASGLGLYVLPLGYAGLALGEACRQLPPHLLLGRRDSRASAIGFDSGDFVTLPSINR